MNRRFLFSLLGAVLCGLIAIWITQRIIQNSQRPTNLTKVLVAATSIPSGTTITNQMVKLAEYQKVLIPSGTTADLTQVVGKIAKAEIGANNYVLAQNLMKPGDSPIFSGLSENSRAMAIRVDEASSIGGFANPGNHVDVVAVLSPGSGAKQVSKVIAQDLKILANNQNTQEISGAAIKLGGTVTLEVTQAQAAVLTLAMREGNLHLIGRNPSNREQLPQVEVVVNSMVDKPMVDSSTPRSPGNISRDPFPPLPSPSPTIKPSPSVAPTKMAQTIKVWKGSTLTEVQVTK